MKWLYSIFAIPIQRRHWAAAEDARRAERWQQMVEHVEALHRWYFESDESHFLLGSGYAHLGRDEEAISEFSKIEKQLKSNEAEEQKQLTLALCFSRVGDWKGAVDVLNKFGTHEWSSKEHQDYFRSLLERTTFNMTFERDAWPAVQEARRDRNWSAVLRELDALHSKGFGTCTTLVAEAEAHGNMGSWARCLDVLDNIGEMSPYASSEIRSRFYWLRALALLKLGRIDAYEDATTKLDEDLDCPPDIRDELERAGLRSL